MNYVSLFLTRDRKKILPIVRVAVFDTVDFPPRYNTRKISVYSDPLCSCLVWLLCVKWCKAE